MSDGLNKRFMRDPVGFMRRHVIHFSSMESLARRYDAAAMPDTGVHAFDLRRDTEGDVQLRPFPFRGSALGRFSHQIVAYWLPWGGAHASSQCVTPTTDMALLDEADFFFTSRLAGCQMLIATELGGLRAYHIPGNISQADRTTAGLELLGADYNQAKRWSSTQNYGADNVVNFVGVRRTAGWTFYSQSTDVGQNQVAVEELR